MLPAMLRKLGKKWDAEIRIKLLDVTNLDTIPWNCIAT